MRPISQLLQRRVQRSATLAVTVFALLAGHHATAGEQVIACPAKLPASSVKIEAPAGFTVHVPSGLFLRGATFMAGPPDSMAISIPNRTTKKGNKEITVWNELEGTDEKWMACVYGSHQDVLAGQRVDDRAKVCTLTSTREKTGGFSYDVRCTW
ncbi:MAG: STY0301 family protein [Gammaproteobacteria bacterium]